MIYISSDIAFGNPERVCVYFKNGSKLEVLGTTTDIDICNDHLQDICQPLGRAYPRHLAPSLSVTVSGDLKLILTETEDQSVVIKTLDGLL